MRRIIEEAINNNDLYSFLVGKDKYKVASPYADVPTDPHKAFEAVEEYSRVDKNIFEEFVNNIKDMSNDPNYSWFSLYYLVAYLRYLDRENIEEDISSLIKVVELNISRNKNHLNKDKRWGGSMWENGLWGDTLRMVDNINEEFGLNITVSK